MRFMDDLFESSFSNSPFVSLELAYTGSDLPFSEKSKKLLATYFSRKKEVFFADIWEKELAMPAIEDASKGIF